MPVQIDEILFVVSSFIEIVGGGDVALDLRG
jgi:hypothetical protein